LAAAILGDDTVSPTGRSSDQAERSVSANSSKLGALSQAIVATLLGCAGFCGLFTGLLPDDFDHSVRYVALLALPSERFAVPSLAMSKPSVQIEVRRSGVIASGMGTCNAVFDVDEFGLQGCDTPRLGTLQLGDSTPPQCATTASSTSRTTRAHTLCSCTLGRSLEPRVMRPRRFGEPIEVASPAAILLCPFLAPY
jgi:hypothetical protein